VSDLASRVKGLQETRANIWEQAKALLDAAGTEPLGSEARASFDAMNADLDTRDAEINDLIKVEERNQKADEARSAYSKLFKPGAETPNGDTLDADVRAFLRGETRSLDIVRGEAMPVGRLDEMRAVARGEQRTLSRLTAAAGQNTVKTSFYDQLLQNLIVNAALLTGGATVLSTESGEIIQLPKTLTHSTAALTAEAGTIAASDPTFGQLSLSAYKYAVLVQLSRELVDDTSVDLLGYLAMEMGRAVGNAAGTDFIIGNGTNKPRGITIDTTLGVTGGTAVVGAFTADNLIDLFYSVAPVYRRQAGASWLMADATVGAVRKLKDTQGRYLWEPSLVLGAPDTFNTKPIVTDPNVAAVGLNNKSVVFGDLSKYFIRQVSTIRMEQSNDFAFSSDLVTFKAAWRADGALTDLTGAVKHFVGAAS
jgi:HK97 family phage major capsid protein